MNKKNRIKITTLDLFGDYSYPSQSWSVPSWVAKSENFIETLKDIITCDVTEEKYKEPDSFKELFAHLRGRNYAIFEDRFLVCLTQGRLAYLVNTGFTKVSASEEVFELSNWKISIL